MTLIRKTTSVCCSDCNIHYEKRLDTMNGWKDYKELRYSVENGICLCVKHHPRKRKEELELIPLFRSIVLKH